MGRPKRDYSDLDQYLVENYLEEEYKSVAVKFNTHKSVVCKRASLLGLNKRRRWTDEDVMKLKTIWSTNTMKFILDSFKLGRGSWTTLSMKARKLGLKRGKRPNRKCDLSPLLSDSLESFYWMGFLLADGYFSENGLGVSISSRDKCHLAKLCKLIQVNDIKTFINHGSFSSDTPMVQIKCDHRDVIRELRPKFDLHKAKTYNPPDTLKYQFSNKQSIALIIGFLDGDGSIGISKNAWSIQLTNHSSWIFFHLWIMDRILDIFGLNNAGPKIMKNGYCKTSLYNDVTIELGRFIKQYKLPHLSRKWDNVFNHEKFKQGTK